MTQDHESDIPSDSDAEPSRAAPADGSSIETAAGAAPRHGRRLLLLAIIIALATGVAYYALADKTPALDRTALSQREAQWRSSNLESYRLELEVELPGRPLQAYSVSVHRGEVQRFELDGRQATGDASYYTIDGLFDTLTREIEISEKSDQIPGAPRGAILRASFDDEYGFPRLFKRFGGNHQSCIIRVREFVSVHGNVKEIPFPE